MSKRTSDRMAHTSEGSPVTIATLAAIGAEQELRAAQREIDQAQETLDAQYAAPHPYHPPEACEAYEMSLLKAERELDQAYRGMVALLIEASKIRRGVAPRPKQRIFAAIGRAYLEVSTHNAQQHNV